MIQTGDPLGTGSGTQAINLKINDLRFDEAGVLVWK
jgi:hypothetical protein